jgi:hypothetical protein
MQISGFLGAIETSSLLGVTSLLNSWQKKANSQWQENLEYVQSIDGNDVQPVIGKDELAGAPSSKALLLAQQKEMTVWQSADESWYSHPDPNFVPKSTTQILWRPDGRVGMKREDANGVSDGRISAN